MIHENTVKPNSYLIVDGSLSSIKIVNEILEKLQGITKSKMLR